jgi:hypothetical protein
MNYAAGSLFGNTVNIYLHGTVIISLITLFFGLLTSGSLGDAVLIVFDFYLSKLLPWPLDEAYMAQTVADFIISHAITVAIGLTSATFRYHRNIR